MLAGVKLYTDGSCSPNPGSGGWAVVIVREGEPNETINGAEPETTNNRMELTAALRGLQHFEKPLDIEVNTDSTYLKDGITSWLPRWQQRGWTTITGEPVANQDLWLQLAEQITHHRVSWNWVKGHASDELNNLADALAGSARTISPLPLDDEEAVHIFLAITWRQKSLAGGWGCVMRYGNRFKTAGGIRTSGSGNGLHIHSAVEALKLLKRAVPVHLYTNSGYLSDGASKWLGQWRQRGWQTRDGREVSNISDWRELAALLTYIEVQFHQVDKEAPPCHLLEAKELAGELYDEEFAVS